MKKKYIDLLKYLSIQNSASTSNEIANVLQVSPRSVKNFVHEINSMYGKKIILSSRSGYTINSKSNISLLLNEDTEVLPQTHEERSYYIIKQLFLIILLLWIFLMFVIIYVSVILQYVHYYRR